jgi:DNA-directed RNA polymerase specialized sigma24 family protein
MQDTPSKWDAYLRLQTRSSRNSTVDSYSWGLEEEMNLFLENPDLYIGAEAKHLERANAAAARRERARAKMRRDCAADLTPEPVNMDRQLDAREALRLIQHSVTPANWLLLLQVAHGHPHEGLAQERGIRPGTLRVLVSRLRNQLAHVAA